MDADRRTMPAESRDHGDHHGHLHGDDHAHAHDHPGGQGHHPWHAHEHGHPATDARRLRLALGITLVFMLVEIVGGIVARSLALIADAGHMLADAGSLALALFALRASLRPASTTYSYGQQRYEVLAAFVNGLALVTLSVWIAVDACMRLLAPQPVHGGIMLVTASLGLAANLGGFLVLREGGDSLNMRAALLHIIGDVLGSAATIAAACLILATGWMPVDPLLSAVVALLIMRGGWSITRRTAHILLEGTPSGFDVDRVAADLTGLVPGIRGVHHVHAWSLDGKSAMITLHAVLSEEADRKEVLHAIQQRLRGHFGVDHATVQIEHDDCADACGSARCGDSTQPLEHGDPPHGGSPT